MAESDSAAKTALAYFQQLEAETAKELYDIIKTYFPWALEKE
jgi:hypothetical protein